MEKEYRKTMKGNTRASKGFGRTGRLSIDFKPELAQRAKDKYQAMGITQTEYFERLIERDLQGDICSVCGETADKSGFQCRGGNYHSFRY